MEFKKDDNIYLPMNRFGPNGKPTDKIQLRQSPATDSDNKYPIRLYTRGEPVEVATKRDGSFIVKDKGNGKFALVKGKSVFPEDAIGYIQTKYLLKAGEAERASAAGHSMGAAAGSATYSAPQTYAPLPPYSASQTYAPPSSAPPSSAPLPPYSASQTYAPPSSAPPSSAPPPPYDAVLENLRKFPIYNPQQHQPLPLPDMSSQAAAAYVPPVEPGGMPTVQMFQFDENGDRFTYGPDRTTRIYRKGGTRRRKYKGKGRGKSKTARKSRNKKNRNRRTKSKSRN